MLTRNTQKYAVQLPGHHNMLSYLKVLVKFRGISERN